MLSPPFYSWRLWNHCLHLVLSSWILLGTQASGIPAAISSRLPAAPTAAIVFLGDSLTAGYGLNKEEAFPALLEGRVNEAFGPGVSIINAGVSGSKTASGLGRLRWQLKGQPTHLVLALGANDGLQGLNTEVIKENLAAIIKLAQAHKIKVLLAGMKLPLIHGEAYNRAFEALFADLAKSYHLVFMPFLLADVGGIAALNQADGLHPNAAGHKVIARNLWPYLQELLIQ